MRVVHRSAPAPGDLGSGVMRVPEGAELKLDLRLESVMEGVLVSGTIRGRAVGDCVRCLIEVEQPLDVELQELYAYPERAVPGATAEDDEVREIEGDLIDLEPAVRDAVVLALPFQPVCREDCPGLCSECGVRLDADPGHRHEVADPRWAALQELMVDDELGSVGADPNDQKES